MRFWGVFACILVLQSLCCGRTDHADTAIIALQPLRPYSKEHAAAMKGWIEKKYAARVVLLQPLDLPPESYYPPKGRYRADKLLYFLKTRTNGPFDKIIGLTSVDISTTKGAIPDWGVFGLGILGGKTCVVSPFRLLSGGVGKDKFMERMKRVTLHELGHTFGIPHCPSMRCLMNDAKGTSKTIDASTGEFCATCRARLKGIVR